MTLLPLIWGLIAGSAVFLGALIAVLGPGRRVIAAAMAFASGVLLSVAAFDLLEEAFEGGGLLPAALGYLAGAALFSLGLAALRRAGYDRGRRPAVALVPARQAAGVVALGTVLDGIPEALMIGLAFYEGEGLALATVIAVFLSNMPEAASATTRMRDAGRSPAYIVAVWAAVAVTTGLAALAGHLLLRDFSPEGVAAIQALAGGAFIVFIADAIIPEAFVEEADLTGAVVAIGFLVGFAVSRLLA
jgi:ZIP family zinc transporter